MFGNPSEVDKQIRAKLANVSGDPELFNSEEYQNICRLFSYMPESVFKKYIDGAMIYLELMHESMGEVTISNVIKLLTDKNRSALTKI